MHEYDRLPPELRTWLATAALPWRPRSVQTAFDKALAKTGDPSRALQELNCIQRRLLAKDAQVVWGQDYPT